MISFAGHVIKAPTVAGADVHELDEAYIDTGAAEVGGDIGDAAFVHAATDDGVDLYRREARFLRGLDAGKDFRNRELDVVHAAKGGVVQGVQAD
jgi:hypothetical protein